MTFYLLYQRSSALCIGEKGDCVSDQMCAVCALITEKYVLFSNCGDSRGVLSVRGDGGGSNPALATQDHKPSNTIERERIQNAGGNVMIQRVNGSLAVSR